MRQLNILKAFSAFLLLTLCVFAPLFNASANPTSAKLSFNYKSNGTLAVNVRFNSPITSRCIARHRSGFYYEGDVAGGNGVISRSTLSRSLSIGRKSTSLRAFGLDGVVQKDGKDPIMSVQVRLQCSGSETINSNVEARFIRCGSRSKRVSAVSYLSQLRKKLAFSK